MNLIDSSCWIEFFKGSNHYHQYKSIFNDSKNIIVPTICLTEVTKRMFKIYGSNGAELAAAHMLQGQVVELNEPIALLAADLGNEFKLGIADSIILATASETKSTLYTMDSDFRKFKGVKYFPKK